jgi:hypothetical protein
VPRADGAGDVHAGAVEPPRGEQREQQRGEVDRADRGDQRHAVAEQPAGEPGLRRAEQPARVLERPGQPDRHRHRQVGQQRRPERREAGRDRQRGPAGFAGPAALPRQQHRFAVGRVHLRGPLADVDHLGLAVGRIVRFVVGGVVRGQSRPHVEGHGLAGGELRVLGTVGCGRHRGLLFHVGRPTATQ